jgi:hypothetical protein
MKVISQPITLLLSPQAGVNFKPLPRKVSCSIIMCSNHCEASMPGRYSISSPLIRQLIQRRHDLNMSQIDVDLSMDKNSQCGKWESGVRTPQLDSLENWCSVLNAQLQLVPNRGDDGEEAERQGQQDRTEPC